MGSDTISSRRVEQVSSLPTGTYEPRPAVSPTRLRLSGRSEVLVPTRSWRTRMWPTRNYTIWLIAMQPLFFNSCNFFRTIDIHAEMILFCGGSFKFLNNPHRASPVYLFDTDAGVNASQWHNLRPKSYLLEHLCLL